MSSTDEWEIVVVCDTPDRENRTLPALDDGF